MPTGYTAPIYEGKEITLANFILMCSRAMGARILERDNDMGDFAPRRYDVDDTYHREKLAEVTERLTELRAMSLADCQAEADNEFQSGQCDYEKSVVENTAMRSRYDEMLTRVHGWIPPTDDHQGLKSFMVEQLETGREFDCPIDSYLKPPVRKTGAEWRSDQIKSAKWNEDYHSKELASEIWRAEGRNKWMKELCDSIGVGFPDE